MFGGARWSSGLQWHSQYGEVRREPSADEGGGTASRGGAGHKGLSVKSSVLGPQGRSLCVTSRSGSSCRARAGRDQCADGTSCAFTLFLFFIARSWARDTAGLIAVPQWGFCSDTN